jgi:plastocyanin
MARKTFHGSVSFRVAAVPKEAATAPALAGRIILPRLPGGIGVVTPPGPPPKTVTVNISAAGEGLRYSLPRVEVYPGDSVKWVCRKGPFAIHFLGFTPVEQISFCSDRQGSIVAQVPTANPVYGCFKYFVAVYDRRARTVLTDDPDIIVDPKPKGGRAVLCDIIVDPKPKGGKMIPCDIIVDPKPKGGGPKG